jgi:hypothetical protein
MTVNWWKTHFPFYTRYNNYAVIHSPQPLLHSKGTALAPTAGGYAHPVDCPVRILNFHIVFIRRVNTCGITYG